MAEAAFFYNTTTQRPDRRKPNSTAQSVEPAFKRSHSSSNLKPQSAYHSSSSNSKASKPDLALTSTNSNLASPDGGQSLRDRMLPPPLVDLKHTINQTNKAQVQAQRKASLTSGTSTDHKNANQSVESRPAAVTRGEQPGSSTSISSLAGSSGLTVGTSSDTTTDVLLVHPFTKRNGRRYIRDPALLYPLPCDLIELNRQTLRTMLLCQVFGGPICSPFIKNNPPGRVLDSGCGTGYWSAMCHRHFSQRGFSSISFTGMDIAPLAPRTASDDNMNWRFVQHDLRQIPYPFRNDEFDLIMSKDLSLILPTSGIEQQRLLEEYFRILKPGGTVEIWDGDHALRMLQQHIPPSTNDDDNEVKNQLHANSMGTYTITAQTPLTTPHNQFLIDYNFWLTQALEARSITPMPCPMILPSLIADSDKMVGIGHRRQAIPLGEVRWEREGIGGAMTQGQNGSNPPGISSKGKHKESDRRLLTAQQAALRRTALMTVVQMIESLEPLLREASGKGQDEWDRWYANMMNDLLNSNGTHWGECLEVSAWWYRKK